MSAQDGDCTQHPTRRGCSNIESSSAWLLSRVRWLNIAEGNAAGAADVSQRRSNSSQAPAGSSSRAARSMRNTPTAITV